MLVRMVLRVSEIVYVSVGLEVHRCKLAAEITWDNWQVTDDASILYS
jgi:hypothetical protein